MLLLLSLSMFFTLFLVIAIAPSNVVDLTLENALEALIDGEVGDDLDPGDVPSDDSEIEELVDSDPLPKKYRVDNAEDHERLIQLSHAIIPPGRLDPFDEIMDILHCTRDIAVDRWISANVYEFTLIYKRALSGSSSPTALYSLAVSYAYSVRVTHSQRFSLLPRFQETSVLSLERLDDMLFRLNSLAVTGDEFAGRVSTYIESIPRVESLQITMAALLGDVVLLMRTFPDAKVGGITIEGSIEDNLKGEAFIDQLLHMKHCLLEEAANTIRAERPAPDYNQKTTTDEAAELERVLALSLTEVPIGAGAAEDTEEVHVLCTIPAELSLSLPSQADINDVFADLGSLESPRGAVPVGVVPEGAPKGNQATFIYGSGEEGEIQTTTPSPM